jgi:hypothetical protein
VHERLVPYYSEIGRPSVDRELMIRMLIIGYSYGLRSERKLAQEVELHLAYRWFCRLDLDDKVPHHSTFSKNRLHRFRESDMFRHIFERVVATCMASGLVSLCDHKLTILIASAHGRNSFGGGAATGPHRAWYTSGSPRHPYAAAKNELPPDNARTTMPATKQDARQKAASPPVHDAKVTSNAESKPNTMEGWSVHGVANGAAVLEGPDGYWRVKRGDTIPGAGRIEAIVRWGNRWVVVTSSGLISTP